jgi:endonuclease-8
MPEGNEIHRWAERHQAAFGGKVVRADGPQGRFKDVDVIDGRKLLRVMAVGKHLGYVFGRDRILHIHLGLQGDFTEGTGPLPEVRGALRLRMWNAAAIRRPVAKGESRRHTWYADDDGTNDIDPKRVAWVELRGPMDCSIYTDAKWDKLRERLGPDPLNQRDGGVDGKGGDDPARAFAKILKSRKAIGELLMDQSVIAGIGNIYRAELLFRARLSPFTPGNAISEQRLKAIWNDALPLMRAGMADRRIVTTIPCDRPSSKGKNTRKRPDKDEVHYVYRRNGQPCFLCGTTVEKREMAGRNLFWCPVCQAER